MKNDLQTELVTLLKAKGTGLHMGKSLGPDALARLQTLLMSLETHCVTKATLLTALLALPQTPEEAAWMAAALVNFEQYFPEDLWPILFFKNPDNLFEAMCHALIRGQNLTYDQANWGISQVFNPEVPDTFKAVFLEALRLKRETEDEHLGIYDYLWTLVERQRANLHYLVDLSTAYDGYNRTPFLLPFTAALLASVGVPCLLHGIDEVSPKRGMNTFKLLEKAGKNPLNTYDEVQARIENETIGWGYIDESVFCPALFQLKNLRQQMVKRPILATLEKLLMPFRAKETYLVTSYTHPPYRQTMQYLIRSKSWDKGVIFRGAEGGIQLSQDRQTPRIFVAAGQESVEDFVRPEHFGITEKGLPESECLDRDAILTLGIGGLSGNISWVSDLLIYQAAAIMTSLGLSDRDHALCVLREAISSGKAILHWEK